MSTIFIAVQCYQCSTMQVKQMKKSSNKWSCVVCNEKQSVQKVFAQGFMAKDVRKYVQSFNMSRQFAEQESLLMDQQTLVPKSEQEESEEINQNKKKRTDWSEYINPHEEVEIEDDSGDVLELNVVTELPKALFKKPKLRNYPTRLDSQSEDREKGFRPVFGKTNANKKINTAADKGPSTSGGTMAKGPSDWSIIQKQASYHFADKEPNRHPSTTAMGASKWRDYITQDHDDADDRFAHKAPQRQGSTNVKMASKWNEFIDDDHLRVEDDNDAAFGTTLNDQRVEDDIHPDFQ